MTSMEKTFRIEYCQTEMPQWLVDIIRAGKVTIKGDSVDETRITYTVNGETTKVGDTIVLHQDGTVAVIRG